MTHFSENVKPSSQRNMAPISNVALFSAMLERLIERGTHLPGFGAFYGWPGLGKSQCCIYAHSNYDAVRIEVGDSWTKGKLLRAILHEVDRVPRKGTVSDLTDRVIEVLGSEAQRPLVIDEADKLIDKGMIELIREIQEFTQIPVVLVGEERLPDKLRRYDRVYDRVLAWQPAQLCDLSDTRKLATWYAPKITIADDLLLAVLRASEGRARRISNNLAAIKEWSATTGATDIDLKTYGGQVETGAPPLRRAG